MQLDEPTPLEQNGPLVTLLIGPGQSDTSPTPQWIAKHSDEYRLTRASTFQDAKDVNPDTLDVLLIQAPPKADDLMEILNTLSAAHVMCPILVLCATQANWATLLPRTSGVEGCMNLASLTTDQIHRRIRYAGERWRMMRRLRNSKARFELALRGANDGLWDWNLETDRVFWSDRWCSIMGYEASEIAGYPSEWLDKIHSEDRNNVEEQLQEHLNGNTPHFQSEYRVMRSEEEVHWVLSRGLAVRDSKGKAVRIAGSLTDIHERKMDQERVAHEALHDSLTGLPNRTLIMDRLSRCFERSRRHKGVFFAVLFLDLDRFKIVNDSLGHQAGDRLLLEIAGRIRACVRSGDTVARLSGDEFTVLLDDLRACSDALHVAERIINELKKAVYLDQHEVYTSASIGIAFSNPGYETPDELLRDADTAMYRAKEGGRSKYVVYGPGMHAQTMALLKMEAQLRRAIDNNQLTLVYQPILSLEDQSIVAFEALVRWPRPDDDWIMPIDFLPVAEETGLILPLGRWVLMEACRRMTLWIDEGLCDDNVSIHVNLSARQFKQTGLVAEVKQVLNQWPKLKGRLRLEITETALMARPQDQSDVLLALKELGAQVQIDDFGTGYSSLANLAQLPVDGLKIDRSFVTRMHVDSKNSKIVQAIVTLAQNLGISVAAEGIETAEQLAVMTELGCNHGQGYLFARPLDPVVARDVLEAGTLSILKS